MQSFGLGVNHWKTKMKTYTIEDGRITEGIRVEPRVLSSGITIPAVVVGEAGRGRKIGFLPVELSASRAVFDAEGKVVISHVLLSKTAKGGHKLVECDNDNNQDECLIVFRTTIGFRGGNAHTGDRIQDSDPPEFLPFPFPVLIEGTIAQGNAGRMGSGQQIIAIAQKGIVFRTAYYGRLYGRPPSHYYLYNGTRILVATWEERVATDIF
jgi:hypothetical protein